MTIGYVPKSLRGSAAWCWLAYVLCVAYVWLGVLGITLVCVCGHARWRNLFAIKPGAFVFDAESLRSAWLTPWALWVRQTSGDAWLCVDEATPQVWAQLHRDIRSAL